MVCIAKYCATHEALLKLQGVEESDFIWHKLEDKDICCMEDPEKIRKEKNLRKHSRSEKLEKTV